MKRIEIYIDSKVNTKEFGKTVGFISEHILSYSFDKGLLSVVIDNEEYEEEIIRKINSGIDKFINTCTLEKKVYNNDIQVNYHSDIQSIHFFDEGMAAFSDKSKFVYEYIEGKVLGIAQEIAKKLNSEIVTKIYPVLLPIEAYKKTGYLKRSPQYAIFCCNIVEDMDILNEFYKKEKESIKNSISSPEYALSPSACFHVYEEYKNQTLKNNKIVTFTQSVFRNEGRFNFKEFGRFRDYHVREIVFIGDDFFVREAIKEFVELVTKFVESLEINASIQTASDPFVLPKMQKFKKIQYSDNSKLELRVKYEDDKDMSVASFNLHGTAFTHPFNIKVVDRDTVTGCIGFGLERFTICFLCQHGEDIRMWPKDMQKIYIDKVGR